MKSYLSKLALFCLIVATFFTETTFAKAASPAPPQNKELEYIMSSLYGKTGILYLMNQSNERDMLIGSNKPSQVSTKIPKFKSLIINIPALITLEQGPINEVTVIGDDNIMHVISAISDNDQLVISAQRSFNTKQPLIIKITAPTFYEVRIDSSTVYLQVANIQQSSLNLDLKGHIKALFTGQIGTLNMNVRGVANISGHDFVTQNSTVKAEGKVGIALIAKENAHITATGSSRVDIYGQPKHKTSTTLGLSTINFIEASAETKKQRKIKVQP